MVSLKVDPQMGKLLLDARHYFNHFSPHGRDEKDLESIYPFILHQEVSLSSFINRYKTHFIELDFYFLRDSARSSHSNPLYNEQRLPQPIGREVKQSLWFRRVNPSNIFPVWLKTPCIDFFAHSWKWKSFSCVRLFVTSWTIQFMEFSRPQYWSR